MATKVKQPPPRKRPIRPGHATSRHPWPAFVVAAAGLVALVIVLVLTVFKGGDAGTGVSAGLPKTSDYHSLLVNPADPKRLVLGTHGGLYVSADGGRHWRFDTLSGSDAMSLARTRGKTIWLAGHDVLKKSSDGGTTWTDVRPSGLPGLDIHGFATDRENPNTLYAAVAGNGLYRSTDGGQSFTPVSESVGGSVMALAVMPDGRILAADMGQGLLASGDSGKSWRQSLQAQLMGLAINPSDPKRLLATGAGIALSTDGGKNWRSVLDLPDGAGPVAWSESDPRIAYAVGFNRTLYRSTDGGASWAPVGKGT